MSERTIEASPQRRHQARMDGRFPRSRELTISAMGLIVLASLYFFGSTWFDQASQFVASHLEAAPSLSIHVGDVETLTTKPLAGAVLAMAPVLVVSFVAMFAIQLTQGGFVWLPQRVAIDVSRIGPGNMSHFVSIDRTVRVLFATFKMFAGLAALGCGVWFYRVQLVSAPSGSLLGSALQVAWPMMMIALSVVLVVTVLSAGEYAVRLASYYRSLRMSSEELREENLGRTSMRVQSSFNATENNSQRSPHPPAQRNSNS